MRVRRTADTICIELPIGEARALLNELSDVRGGARLPKLRQVCKELEDSFSLVALMTKRRQMKKGDRKEEIGSDRRKSGEEDDEHA